MSQTVLPYNTRGQLNNKNGQKKAMESPGDTDEVTYPEFDDEIIID